MDNFVDLIILFFFLIEVAILFKLEKVLWGTYYTPLNFLMIPYTVVLLITINLPSSLEFVTFYYPSILVWSVGLIVFFLPSLLLGLIKAKDNQEVDTIYIQEPIRLKPLYVISGLLLLASLYYLFTKSHTSEEMIGSDEFASETLVGGFWGHVREVLLAIMILIIFLFQKQKKYYYFLIVGTLFVAIIYQVKSWILVPVMAGVIMRLMTEKTRFRLNTIFYVVIGGSFMFFLSYYLILVFAVDETEFNVDILEMIYKHFIFYLISGTAGLSVDIQSGILEVPNPESIFAPFLNIISLIDGREFVSPTNPVFLYIGWTSSNVRTFFGTLYINLGIVGAVWYVLFLAFLLYFVLLWLKRKPNMWLLSFYGLMASLLFMGWFEFYFFHLVVVETPLILLFFYVLLYVSPNKKYLIECQ